MKKLLFHLLLPFFAFLFSSSIFAAEESIPEGLSGSDWSSIRAAYEGERHAVREQPDGSHSAWNPGQSWRTHFDGRGFLVQPSREEWTWGMDLKSVGTISTTGTPRMEATGNRLSYHWSGNIEEWFINDKRGLEQGWTINARLGDVDSTLEAEPLTLTLSLRGGLTPEISSDGKQISFQQEQKNVLTFGGLKAWDANDTPLVVSFVAGEKEDDLMVIVEEAGAEYPITIDPVAQQAYLKAGNAGAGDNFGSSVAVSGDTVVVGAWGEDGDASSSESMPNNSASNAGAAYVFVRSGLNWSQQAYLKADNAGINDFFGKAVAVFGDTVVVGADGEEGDASSTESLPNDNASDAGAAYVYVRNGTVWSQQAYLKAGNADGGDHFGNSVAIDGDSLVVGAYAEWGDAGSTETMPNNNALSAGAAYVYVRSGTNWSQQAYLKAGNAGATNLFGYSVAVSGGTVVIGAYGEEGDASSTESVPNDNAGYAGAAYVYVRSGTNWSQQAYVKAGNADSSDYFGYSVAVSGDTMVVGAYQEDGDADSTDTVPNENENRSGAAYVFVRSGTNWSQQAYLKAGDADASDYFGYSVAVFGDAIVVGAYGESSSAENPFSNIEDSAGAAYIFARTGNNWSQQARLKALNAESFDIFGRSVAVADDTVLVGVPGEDGDASSTESEVNDNAGNAGALYIFNLDKPEIVVEQPADVVLQSGSTMRDFGSGLVGSTSDPKVFTIRNTGTAALTGLAVSVSGDFSVENDLSGTSIAAGGSDTFSVVFSPGSEGPQTGTLEITSNDADENPFQISLTGQGTAPVVAAQNAYLKGGETGNQFGYSVAIDGDTVVVGSPRDDGDAGGAYVFILNGSTWIQQAYLQAFNMESGDRFGETVAIYGDTLIVGAPSEDGDENSADGSANNNASGAGAVYVFVRSGSTWSPQAYLKASNAGSLDSFGHSLAVSGETLVIGSRGEDGDSSSSETVPNNDASSAGAAYVFVRDGTSWSQEAYLKAMNAGASDFFGSSVAIDGESIVVGAYLEAGDASSTEIAPNDNGNSVGAAYVFRRSGTAWNQEAYLKASNANSLDQFASSVAISGEKLAVGAHQERGDKFSTAAAPNDNATGAGAVYIFGRSGNTWTQEAYLKASNAGAFDQFGYSVSMTGSILVVGAYQEGGDGSSTSSAPNDNASGAGATYVFTRGETTWTEEAYLKASNAGAGDQFGGSVGIDGGTLVIGARFEDGDSSSTAAVPNDNASNSGAAYVFEFTSQGEIAFNSAISNAGLTGADAFPNAIPFDDGVENLLKYAFNMDLSGPDSSSMAPDGDSGLPGGEVIEENGQKFWQVQYVARKASGLVYSPKKSTTLAAGSFEELVGAVSEEDIDSQWKRVTVKEPCDPATTPKCFSRVEVILPGG